MDSFKVIYMKYDDLDTLVEKLKAIMEEYDMYLKGIDENKYIFDRDRSYTRAFTIEQVSGGWIALVDEEESKAEELSMELSDLLPCSCICLGIVKDVLCYTIWENGEASDQYMSSLKNYEYNIDDDVVNMYKGNPEAFRPFAEDECIEELKEILDDCRGDTLSSREAYNSILRIIGIAGNEDEMEEEVIDDAGDEFEPVFDHDIFYVDFESINIKTDDRDEVIGALEQISEGLGFKRAEEFKDDSREGKSLFKKMMSSISESRRLLFFISPPCEGWVTLAGEVEILHGGEPVDWEFLHIEDKLSDVTGRLVINIFADAEKWGFRIFRSGAVMYKYVSGSENYDMEGIPDILQDIDSEKLEDIAGRPLAGAEDINETFNEFCGMLGIRNYRINIPMDYSEEEYKNSVIDSLPDGDGFIDMKFIRQK